MSWEELSKLSGVEKRTMYDWRMGKSSIPQSIIILLDKKFHVSSPNPEKVF